MNHEEKYEMFRNRLAKVFRHLSKQARRAGVSCYRLYDHDLPEFPFCVEIYGKKLYVAEYMRRHGMTEEEHNTWLDTSCKILCDVTAISAEDIFLKVRQRKPGRQGQYQKTANEPAEFIAEENGLKFFINLAEYLDTGLFLDHRITRQMVRERSREKKVLNLFAYTGSFSVYAAAGGACEIVTADLSKTYLTWAQRNMQLNGFDDNNKYKFIQADCMEYIKSIPGNYFDIIVLDPPTFSNSKRMDGILDVQRDHANMINDCLKGLKQGGAIIFSTNFKKFKLDTASINSRQIKDITRHTTPFDFEGKLNRYCFLIEKI